MADLKNRILVLNMLRSSMPIKRSELTVMEVSGAILSNPGELIHPATGKVELNLLIVKSLYPREVRFISQTHDSRGVYRTEFS